MMGSHRWKNVRLGSLYRVTFSIHQLILVMCNIDPNDDTKIAKIIYECVLNTTC
jgi:hypothetical protein